MSLSFIVMYFCAINFLHSNDKTLDGVIIMMMMMYDAACRVRYIDKPDFQRYTGTYWGAWFRDADPPETGAQSATWSDKIWVSLHYRGSTLLEYANYDDFRQENQ